MNTRIDFNRSTDKKLCFVYRDLYYSIHLGMHGCILGLSKSKFAGLLEGYIGQDIPTDDIYILYGQYKKLQKIIENRLRNEYDKIEKQIKKIKSFDFDAAEKRKTRILNILNE